MEVGVEAGVVPAMMELSADRMRLMVAHQTLKRMGFSRGRARRSYLSPRHRHGLALCVQVEVEPGCS